MTTSPETIAIAREMIRLLRLGAANPPAYIAGEDELASLGDVRAAALLEQGIAAALREQGN